MYSLLDDCKRLLDDDGELVKVNTELVDWSRFPKHFPSTQEQWSKHQEYKNGDIEWIFVSDLLNFSFWNDEVEALGYSAFIAALNEHQTILCDPQQYSHLSFAEFCTLMPNGLSMLPERHQILTDAGQILLDYFHGSFASFLHSLHGSREFFAKLCQYFPSFRDDARSGIWFLKRAQILVADLGASRAWFDEADDELVSGLTVFADYRIPQVLMEFNAISVSSELKQALKRRQLFSVDSEEVLKLRAASVVACDDLRKKLGISAVQLDYFLWDWAQQHKRHLDQSLPFHRTRSVFY